MPESASGSSADRERSDRPTRIAGVSPGADDRVSAECPMNLDETVIHGRVQRRTHRVVAHRPTERFPRREREAEAAEIDIERSRVNRSRARGRGRRITHRIEVQRRWNRSRRRSLRQPPRRVYAERSFPRARDVAHYSDTGDPRGRDRRLRTKAEAGNSRQARQSRESNEPSPCSPHRGGHQRKAWARAPTATVTTG